MLAWFAQHDEEAEHLGAHVGDGVVRFRLVPQRAYREICFRAHSSRFARDRGTRDLVRKTSPRSICSGCVHFPRVYKVRVLLNLALLYPAHGWGAVACAASKNFDRAVERLSRETLEESAESERFRG